MPHDAVDFLSLTSLGRNAMLHRPNEWMYFGVKLLTVKHG
jgi:hypothetical protein